MSSYQNANYRSPERKGVTYRRTAVLACEHRLDFEPPPRVRTTVWCPRCAESRLVMRLVEGFAVRCQGCRYGRFFGTMREAAGKALTVHKNRHPNHAVGLYHDGELETELGNVATDTLPLGIGIGNDGFTIPF